MGRFFLTVLFGVAVFVGVAYYFELWPASTDVPPPSRLKGGPNSAAKDRAAKFDVGGVLYAPWPRPKVQPINGARPYVDPIAVIAGHLGVVDKNEVPAEVEGTLLYIGEEVPDVAIAVAGVAPFMVDPFRYATMNMGDGMVAKFYRRLQQGEVVTPDQVVAMLNPAKGIHDVAMKRAKLLASEAEY